MANKIHSTGKLPQAPWYGQPIMIFVIGVLGATVIFSALTLTLAVVYQDELVISEEDYQQLRDDMRLTKARKEAGE